MGSGYEATNAQAQRYDIKKLTPTIRGQGDGQMACSRVLARSLPWRASWSRLFGQLNLATANLSRNRNVTTGITVLGRHKCPPLSWNSTDVVVPCYKISQCPSLLLQRWLTVYPLPLSPVPSQLSLQTTRSITKVSKRKGKRKTVKAVAKRFYRTGSGKLKYWPAGKVHNMLAKSNKKRRQLRKARYASKTQLKTLNKMLAGW